MDTDRDQTQIDTSMKDTDQDEARNDTSAAGRRRNQKPSANTEKEAGTGVPEGAEQSGRTPFIKGERGKEVWDIIRTEEERAKEGSTIHVDMNGSVVVPGNIFDSIKGRDITVTFDMGEGILWSVNGKDITADRVKDIDFSVRKNEDRIPVTIINGVTGENYSIQISLAYSGEFGFTAMLFIDLGKESAGCTAKLYYYNRDVEELEFLCAGEIAEDGMAGLTFTHASDYVIVVERGAEDTDKTGSDGTTEEETGPGHEETEITGGGKIILFLLAGVIVILAAGRILFILVKRRKEEEEEESGDRNRN